MSRSSLDWDNSYDALEHRYKTEKFFPLFAKIKNYVFWYRDAFIFNEIYGTGSADVWSRACVVNRCLITSNADPMFIPDSNFSIPDPHQRMQVFLPYKLFLSSR